MTNEHGHYEQLCGLAATGQLSAEEEVTLRRHMEGCRDCLDAIVELSVIGAELFTQSAVRCDRLSRPEGMRERFLARAEREGIVSPRTVTRGFQFGVLQNFAFAVVMVMAAFLILHTYATIRPLVKETQSGQRNLSGNSAPGNLYTAATHRDVLRNSTARAVRSYSLHASTSTPTDAQDYIVAANAKLTDRGAFRRDGVSFDLYSPTPIVRDYALVETTGVLKAPSLLADRETWLSSASNHAKPWEMTASHRLRQELFHPENVSVASLDFPLPQSFDMRRIGFNADRSAYRFSIPANQ